MSVRQDPTAPIAWDAHRSEAQTLLDAIGRTPLVRLQRVAPPGVDVLVKVEWYGPTGSVKSLCATR